MKKKTITVIMTMVLSAAIIAGCGKEAAVLTPDEPKPEEVAVEESVEEVTSEETEAAVSEEAKPADETATETHSIDDIFGEEVLNHERYTDTSYCETFTQIVDKLPAGRGYTTVKVGDADVLLVASGVYDDLEGHMAAIDAEIFDYNENDGIEYLGYITSGGTAYPLALKDGKLYSGGNHFMRKSVVSDGMLQSMEEAWVEYDTDGNATYYYNSDDGGDYSNMDSAEAEKILNDMYGEIEQADILVFDEIK